MLLLSSWSRFLGAPISSWHWRERTWSELPSAVLIAGITCHLFSQCWQSAVIIREAPSELQMPLSLTPLTFRDPISGFSPYLSVPQLGSRIFLASLLMPQDSNKGNEVGMNIKIFLSLDLPCCKLYSKVLAPCWQALHCQAASDWNPDKKWKYFCLHFFQKFDIFYKLHFSGF